MMANLEKLADYVGRTDGSNTCIRKGATREEVETQAVALQEAMVKVLDKHAGKVRICNKTKRWWSGEIRRKRKTMGKLKRIWKKKCSEERYKEYKKMRNGLVDLIRKAKRDHWTDVLGKASGDDLWTVIWYTKPR